MNGSEKSRSVSENATQRKKHHAGSVNGGVKECRGADLGRKQYLDAAFY